MKKGFILIISIILAAILLSCGDELYVKKKDYPVVLLDSALKVGETSLKLSLTNYQPGYTPCSEYGVIWSQTGTPTFNDSIQRFRGDLPHGSFTIFLENRFVAYKSYNCLFYAKSDEIVYSVLISLATNKMTIPTSQ